MSTQTAYDAESFERRAQIEYDKTRAEIQHMLEEQKRWNAEQQRWLAEQRKLDAEQRKMDAEQRKIDVEARWYPRWVWGVLIGAAAAMFTALGTALGVYITSQLSALANK